LNVLLAAEESAGIQAMRAVENAGHRIVAVVTRARGLSWISRSQRRPALHSRGILKPGDRL